MIEEVDVDPPPPLYPPMHLPVISPTTLCQSLPAPSLCPYLPLKFYIAAKFHSDHSKGVEVWNKLPSAMYHTKPYVGSGISFVLQV